MLFIIFYTFRSSKRVYSQVQTFLAFTKYVCLRGNAMHRRRGCNNQTIADAVHLTPLSNDDTLKRVVERSYHL